MASICTKLAHFVVEALKSRFFNLTVNLWSDSEIALYWLHSSKPPKQFIANRIKEIKELFPVTVWNHCPTHENPGDLLTREITATQLHTSSLWQQVSQWLPLVKQCPSRNWSKILHLHLCDIANAENTDATANDTKTTTNGWIHPSEQRPGIHNLIDVSRFSALSRQLAVTAYVLPFVKNLQNRVRETDGPQYVHERQEVQRKWIQISQALIYATEIANLRSNSSTRVTLVKQLCLFLDANGFLRCGGGAIIVSLQSQRNAPTCQRGSDYASPNFLDKFSSIVCKETFRRCVTCRKVQGTAFKAGFHQRRSRSRKRPYDLVKIENRSRKRSHKLDGIGVGRIRTFPFLPIPFTTPSLMIH